LTCPTTGSVPKNALEQLAVPATVFCSHEPPAPYRTRRVSETLKASFSLATKVQPLLAVAVGDGAFAAAGGADVTAASAATLSLAALPLPPPQPAKRTATEQKSKCTGFN
jgi:hypothetical protein